MSMIVDIITGEKIPEGYVSLGVFHGSGFSRAIYSDGDVSPATIATALKQAKDELRHRALSEGAQSVISCQVITDKQMMSPVGNPYGNTSYPAYEVIIYGTAIKKE